MEKIKLQDIKIKKAENHIPPKEEKEEKVEKEIKIKKEKPVKKVKINQYLVEDNPIFPKKVPIRKFFVIALYLSILILAFFWGSNFFEKAHVSVEAKRQEINYQLENFKLDRNSSAYEIMINSEVYTESIGLSKTEKVSSKSTGKIKISNLYSTAPIKLNAGSLLKDDRGYPYVIKKDISIPGFKSEDDVITPGVAEVEIEAFLAGEVYDGEPARFTIDSFENTTKFEKVYGELIGVLSGGKDGTIYSLNDADRVIVVDLVNTKIKDNLIKQVESLTPEGYLFYPKLSNFSYYLDGQISSNQPVTKVEIEATLRAILLKKDSLTEKIISKSIKNLEKGEEKEINLVGIEGLDINFKNKDFVIDKDNTSISLELTGDLEAIWQPDLELLKEKLLNIKKDETLPIFQSSRGIVKAKVKIYPPWQKYISENKSRIEITLD